MNASSKPKALTPATKILITGWSGTGKSTVCRELVRRGFTAVDADAVASPYLSEWVEVRTGKWLGRGFPKDFSNEKYNFCWKSTVLDAVLRTDSAVFLCGNADNSFDFYGYFDQIFILDLPESEQRRRMMSRTEHDYGKDSATQDAVIRQQKQLVPKAIRLGAVPIDANQPTELIVDSIIEKTTSWLADTNR